MGKSVHEIFHAGIRFLYFFFAALFRLSMECEERLSCGLGMDPRVKPEDDGER